MKRYVTLSIVLAGALCGAVLRLCAPYDEAPTVKKNRTPHQNAQDAPRASLPAKIGEDPPPPRQSVLGHPVRRARQRPRSQQERHVYSSAELAAADLDSLAGQEVEVRGVVSGSITTGYSHGTFWRVARGRRAVALGGEGDFPDVWCVLAGQKTPSGEVVLRGRLHGRVPGSGAPIVVECEVADER